MSKEKLKKIGDYKENPVVRKHQRNEGYMAAWKETLLVIEWATKHHSNDAQVASKERTTVHTSMQRSTENQMPNDIQSKKRKAYNMLNVDDIIVSKKRMAGHRNSNVAKIESKKRTVVVQSKQRNAENQTLGVKSKIQKCENRTAKSAKIESESALITEQIIYLNKSRVQHIYFKPLPGVNKIVLIACGHNETCISI